MMKEFLHLQVVRDEGADLGHLGRQGEGAGAVRDQHPLELQPHQHHKVIHNEPFRKWYFLMVLKEVKKKQLG